MLSLTPNFTIKDIEKDFEVFAAGIKSDLIPAMIQTLHQVVDRARALTPAEKSFNNITWNLRASIGGVIVSDHAIVETYFPAISQGDEGHSTGIAVAQEVATLIEYDDEITLVFVAGMAYASFVEAKGKDVITGSNQKMEGILRLLLKN
ncbi:hypothetical protein A0256_13610 [Mucilaginibacter sp. PAMC 26640]|nr:hypothetical protein A0256_13610 [Mucilaginibacter sp. PAMC 26640]